MSSEVPEGWMVTKLGDVASLSGGTTPARDNSAYWIGGEVPWATPSDITSLPAGERRISHTDGLVNSLALEECSLKLHPAGTVLMTSRATIGYAAINDVPMTTNQGFLAFRCTDETAPEFLCQWLNANRSNLVAAAGGSTFKELGRGTAKLLPILRPPLDEQQRIAEVLGSVDEMIRLAGQVARATRTTFNRLIDDLHCQNESNIAPLSTFCVPKGLQTGPFGSQLKVSDYVDHGVPVLMPTDLRPDGIDFSGAKATSFEKFAQLKQHGLVVGDILFSRRGDVEKCGVYLEGDPVAMCGTGCLRARIDPRKADPMLIYFLVQSERCGRWLTQNAVGLTMPNLNTSIIGSLPVSNLPIAEQRSWVDALLLAEGACRANETYSAGLDQLKSAISSDLLSGRVRVPA